MLRTTRRGKLLAGLMILSAPLLTACEKKVLAVATKPPSELLTCAAQPDTPVLPSPGIERDRIVGDWILAYHKAWGDCSAKVSGVRAWADALPD